MAAEQTVTDGVLLSVIVPVFNERENVRPLVGEIVSAIDGRFPYEIVYVDDGSDDGTGKVLEQLAASTSLKLRVVTHAVRQGQSAAIVSGVASASGAWIATLDGDGQNVPGDIPALLAAVTRARDSDPNVVCVAGIRVGRRDSFVRKVSSRIANAVRQTILRDGVPDTGCGLKIFRRDAFQALPHFNHLHRFIPAIFQCYGGTVITHPVSHRPRMAGTSKYGISNRLFVGIADLAGVCWLRRRAIDRPWLRGPVSPL